MASHTNISANTTPPQRESNAGESGNAGAAAAVSVAPLSKISKPKMTKELPLAKFFLASLWRVYIKLLSTRIMMPETLSLSDTYLNKIRDAIISLKSENLSLKIPSTISQHPLMKKTYLEGLTDGLIEEAMPKLRNEVMQGKLVTLLEEINKKSLYDLKNAKKNIILSLIAVKNISGIIAKEIIAKEPPQPTETSTNNENTDVDNEEINLDNNGASAPASDDSNTDTKNENIKATVDRIVKKINTDVSKLRFDPRIETMVEWLVKNDEDFSRTMLYLDSMIALYNLAENEEQEIDDTNFFQYAVHCVVEESLYQSIKYARFSKKITHIPSDLTKLNELITNIPELPPLDEKIIIHRQKIVADLKKQFKQKEYEPYFNLINSVLDIYLGKTEVNNTTSASASASASAPDDE